MQGFFVDGAAGTVQSIGGAFASAYENTLQILNLYSVSVRWLVGADIHGSDNDASIVYLQSIQQQIRDLMNVAEKYGPKAVALAKDLAEINAYMLTGGKIGDIELSPETKEILDLTREAMHLIAKLIECEWSSKSGAEKTQIISRVVGVVLFEVVVAFGTAGAGNAVKGAKLGKLLDGIPGLTPALQTKVRAALAKVLTKVDNGPSNAAAQMGRRNGEVYTKLKLLDRRLAG